MRKNWIAREAGVAAVALALSAAGTGTADAAIYDCRISGDRAKLEEVVSYLDTFEFWFNIVTPNATN